MAFKLIDVYSPPYADTCGGGGSGTKWRNLQSASADPLSYEYISNYIYKLLSYSGQYLDEFEIVVDKSKFLYTINAEHINVTLHNYAYQTQYGCTMLISDDTSDLLEIVNENLKKLVQRYLDDIKTKTKINIKKEDKIMTNYNTYGQASTAFGSTASGKIEVIKTQEEIELEEKIAKLKAEYDKKVAKLREEFKTAQEKKVRDSKAKELHDKYQSLIDAGFSIEQAYNILQTKMKMDEF